MTARLEAELHLAKSREFLEAARIVLEHGLVNAACSLAIISGINSKDVVCVISTGASLKSDDHRRAVEELRRSGRVGGSMAPTLSRLLAQKSRSQYASRAINHTDAEDALRRAARLHASADDCLRTRA
jgi:hypothetical protein